MAKKNKSPAYLLWCGKKAKGEAPYAMLVEHRAPGVDSPREFYGELQLEERAPWGTAFAQSQYRLRTVK